MKNVYFTMVSETRKVVTLTTNNVTTHNFNCGELSKEQFIQKMSEDIKIASESYDELIAPELIKRKENFITNMTNTLSREAQKRYKRVSNQEKYIKENLEKEIIKYNSWRKESLSFADFDIEYGKNGISCALVLSFDEVLKGNTIGLENCFDYIQKNKFWQGALGWKIEYECWNKDSMINSSRPQITLILPEELQNEVDTLKKGLAEAISNFYNGCTYWGD